MPCNLVAGKGLNSWLSCSLCSCVFVTFPHVSWSTSELRARLVPLIIVKSIQWVFSDRSNVVLFCGSFLLFMFHVYISYAVLSVLAALWSPAGKALSCVLCYPVFLSLSQMVFRVRHGTWLYQSMSFAFLSTKSRQVTWALRNLVKDCCCLNSYDRISNTK